MQGEAIYKGATRPAMKLGIPLVPLVVLFGTGMLLLKGTWITVQLSLTATLLGLLVAIGCAWAKTGGPKPLTIPLTRLDENYFSRWFPNTGF